MAIKTSKKVLGRLRRQKSIRKKVVGTTERPRFSVFRSLQHVYVQVIDDSTGKTIASASTLSPELVESLKGKKKSEKAKLVGAEAARRCLEKDIQSVRFDRNGFIYHGRVAAIAAGAREAGLKF